MSLALDEEMSQQFDFPVILKPSNRRTVSLVIRDGKLDILVPKHASMRQINELLIQKSTWITRKIIEHKKAIIKSPPNNYRNGSLLFYLGDAKSLHLLSGSEEQMTCTQASIHLQLKCASLLRDQALIKRRLKHWYRQQTLVITTELCREFGQLMGTVPRGVSVRAYRARWGSCSQQGEITFHELLCMVPQSVLEYIVIHELAHLRHPNHSKAFWEWVAQFCPDHRQHTHWLKENRYRIAL